MPTELTASPNLSTLFLKAVATGPARRGGELPTTEYVRRDIEIDRDRLAEYNRVCGFGLRDELPVTYPHVLAFGLAVRLMTDPGFPFPLVGLVHVGNKIRQHRPLLVTESLTQRVWLENLRAHPKGRQFDIVAETTTGDEVVWRSTSTYLRRGKPDESAQQDQPLTALEEALPTATWQIPTDLGRRYARVSGDRNPIHMNSLTAKAFGFPRAIAHGMWSKARCLAAFEGRLPASYSVQVEFRKPVLLGSKVHFTERGRAQEGCDFGLYPSDKSKSDKPHLLGTVVSERS